ncbi:hypothetical protein AB4156_34290, partial [Cupriavidus sp. 2MCAB6]|uniref:hypothetical protein n=1 Tax=Cupriavidus sp. 2MCAB6 TaxID=3232981 RepID=UPI003F8F2966
LRRYSNMGPSFPLFSPDPEAPHTAWYTYTARFASRWGVARPCGRSTRLEPNYCRGVLREAGLGIQAATRLGMVDRLFDRYMQQI